MALAGIKDAAEFEAESARAYTDAKKAVNEKLDDEAYAKYIINNPETSKETFLANRKAEEKAEAEEEAEKIVAAAKKEADESWLPTFSKKGGGKQLNLNQIQKGGRLSARRTKKSINEFLNSSVKSSQILNMVNKQRHTKINDMKVIWS